MQVFLVIFVCSLYMNSEKCFFFQVREMSGNLCLLRELLKGLDQSEKIRELENVWLWQSLENIFSLFMGENIF